MDMLNRFAALDMSSDSDSPSHTPPYPPTRGTTPPAEKVRDAVAIANIWKIDEEMKNTRFRDWKNDNDNNGFSSTVSRKATNRTTAGGFQSTFNTSRAHGPPSLGPVKFERAKPKILNTSSNAEFPSLGGPKLKTAGVWGNGNVSESSSNRNTKSFASTVSEMAERERIANEEQMIAEEAERRRRYMESQTLPIASRFRRRLEDILLEEQDDDDNRYDDNAFPDDNHEPDMDLGYDDNDNDEQ